jgi:predicted AlkP superfamily phosphohydrolase/phosphomutase
MSFKDVDWTRTRAYAVGSFGQIYINLKGVRPQGTVQPGPEYEQLRDRIIREALALRDPGTGEPIIEKAMRREEVYSGDRLDRTPDVILITQRHEYMAFGHADFGSNRLVEPILGLSGHHRPNGLVIVAGPGVRPGTRLEGASIMDIAPTALNVLDVAIPRDMDGHVLSAAFTDAFQSGHPIAFTDKSSGLDVDYDQQSDSDETVVRDRLRGFGYVS